jgi:hypothetical protein
MASIAAKENIQRIGGSPWSSWMINISYKTNVLVEWLSWSAFMSISSLGRSL